MKPSSILLSLASVAAAAQNVVEISINRIQPGQRGLSKRASTYVENIVNNITGGGYYVDVNVGTPPQPQTLVLDTGSSDVWVLAYNADLCTSAKLQQYYGDSCGQTFTPKDSSTYKLVSSQGFSIQYLDGSGSSGDYISDTLSVGGATLKGLQMGYARTAVRGTGIMGLGFSASEAAARQYPNLMDQFLTQGLIGVKAFSLYLNDRSATSGTILFGGLDTGKFIGTLGVVPLLKDTSTGAPSTFAISLSGLSVSLPDGSTYNSTLPTGSSSSGVVAAILDSGTTLSYLPESMATPLFDAVGAYTDETSTGLTFVDCNLLTSSSDSGGGTLAVHFAFAKGSVTIDVPVEEMVLDVFAGRRGQVPSNVPFDRACLFGLQSIGTFSSQSGGSSTRNVLLLGDTFLRSAYVVYDMSHNQVGLAPANLFSSSSNVVELQASDSGIPSATGVKSQEVRSSTTPTATSSSSGGGGDGGSSSGGGGAGATVTVTATPSSKNAAGLPARAPGMEVFGVMAVAGVFALLGGALVAL